MRASWLLVKSELCRAFLIIVISLFALSPTLAQDATATPQADSAPLDTPSRVDIQPVARDEEIDFPGRRVGEIKVVAGALTILLPAR